MASGMRKWSFLSVFVPVCLAQSCSFSNNWTWRRKNGGLYILLVESAYSFCMSVCGVLCFVYLRELLKTSKFSGASVGEEIQQTRTVCDSHFLHRCICFTYDSTSRTFPGSVKISTSPDTSKRLWETEIKKRPNVRPTEKEISKIPVLDQNSWNINHGPIHRNWKVHWWPAIT